MQYAGKYKLHINYFSNQVGCVLDVCIRQVETELLEIRKIANKSVFSI